MYIPEKLRKGELEEGFYVSKDRDQDYIFYLSKNKSKFYLQFYWNKKPHLLLENNGIRYAEKIDPKKAIKKLELDKERKFILSKLEELASESEE